MARRPSRGSGNPAKRAGASTGFWHGGQPGRKPGELLIPAAARGGSLRQDVGVDAFGSPYDRNLVYVTTERQFARSFARSGGSLYMVQPVGDLVPDPDFPFEPPPAYACRAAQVVRVVEADVRMTRAESVRSMAKYSVWEDGSPMYDSEGFITLSPVAKTRGVTVEMLRSLGPWRNTMESLPELSQMIIDAGGEAAEQLLAANRAIEEEVLGPHLS